MMEVALVTFASKCFYKNQKQLVQSATATGIKKIFAWKYVQLLRYNFFWKNIKLLRCKRGAGYWIWHAFIIRKALDEMNDNDVVIFCDAGLTFCADFKNVLQSMGDSYVQLFSAGGFTNRQYTKRDAFVLMGCDEKKYWDGQQTMGGIHFWRKCPDAYRLLDEYEAYCCNAQIVSDLPNKLGENFPEFIDHRHPQSIMSLLAIKYNYTTLPCPADFTGNEQAIKRSDIFLLPNRKRYYSYLDRILLKIGLWY